MYYKKKGLPEDGDIVLCTVKKILYHSIFVSLDEYNNQEGLIHISEIAPGRIRNIRDYVREDKKIVCKVIKVNKERGHIDLSLRRVSVSLRKKKNEDVKLEQKAEVILEQVGKKIGLTLDASYKKIGEKIIDEYGSLYDFFQAIVFEGEEIVKELNLNKKESDELINIVKDRIKIPEVNVEGVITIKNHSEEGVEIIKKSLAHGDKIAKEQNYKISLSYISAPKYQLTVYATDYNQANDIFRNIAEEIVKFNKKYGGDGEFNLKK